MLWCAYAALTSVAVLAVRRALSLGRRVDRLDRQVDAIGAILTDVARDADEEARWADMLDRTACGQRPHHLRLVHPPPPRR